MQTLRTVLAFVAGLGVGFAQTNSLHVDIGGTRSGDVMAKADTAVRAFARQVEKLTRANRLDLARSGRYHDQIPLSFPTRVELYENGRKLPPVGPATRGGGITLAFDTTGPGAFTQTYRDFLQSVFDDVQPTIDTIFGPPAKSQIVHVINWDAQIGDRDALAGGFYVPNNGSGQPEIRFPVYTSGNEAAAVNFIHTLLLAYQGDTPYAFDAFEEGLARAATIKIVKIAPAVPGLDQEIVQQVLENTYDVSPFYDWYNQRALGASKFIPSNLRDQPLPISGSLGGIFLLRYQMSGTAWEKLLVEYPTFIARFNQGYYANPALAADVPGLVALGQQVLNTLRPSDPTVEGLSFAEWFRRQYILETHTTAGLKLEVQPLPITSNLSGPDFGVFLIQTTFFQSLANGDEQLLGGTSFPIFWDPDYNRLNPDTQSVRMDIAGAYGSVTPNFLDQNGGQPYRVAIDVPVQDQVQRVYVPAGAIATASNPNAAYIYGTVVGAPADPNSGLQVRVTADGTVFGTATVTNGAFGISTSQTDPLANKQVLVEVLQTGIDSQQTIYSRKVDKGAGPLALDIRVGGEGTQDFGTLPKGINLIGFTVDPFASYAPDILGLQPAQTLIARYNSSKAAYDLFPDAEPFKIGEGYFVRLPADTPLQVDGRVNPGIQTSVALRPGWNLVADPLMQTIPTTQIRIVHAADLPLDFDEAVGSVLGADFFQFSPGPADSASGMPETGTFTKATQFVPGVGYLVRCLAPEGATMVFAPTTPTRHITEFASPPAPRWQLSLAATGFGGKTECYLSMSPTATTGYDPEEDSQLPPGIGGFQIGSGSLYRDARPVGTQSYSVTVSGLEVGRTYTLRLKELVGHARNIVLKDPVRRLSAQVKPGGHYMFVATSGTRSLTFEVGGVR